MKFKNRRRWQTILHYSIGWTLAFIFLSIVRGEGTEEVGSIKFDSWEAMIAALIAGPFFGSISGFAQILTEEYGYKQISFQKLVIVRFFYALIFLFSIILFGYSIYGNGMTLYDFTFEPGSFAIYLYILTVDLFMFGLRQVNLFLGYRNLSKLLMGKFYTPREEERIFMFLDLQSSTKHAEKLGHIQYSKMIQDCFNDLGVVVENETEIYQYVGDEVILTWRLKAGLKDANCLKAFFNFQQQLERRKAHYIGNYGFLPFFKAGINEGIVTTTEVGKFKKEIAYHGDTINTAARIQGKCNEMNQGLLISGNLKNQLATSNFTFDEMGSIPLKGKAQIVQIYAVTAEKHPLP